VTGASYTSHFIHSDGLGSVRTITDEEGNFVDARSYEAFGTKNVETGSEALAYGFAGEPLDSTTNLAYHRARWMDSRVGRFTGMDSDPAPPDLQTPITLHKYIYGNDEPSDQVDPTGFDGMDAQQTNFLGTLGIYDPRVATVSGWFRPGHIPACLCDAFLGYFRFDTVIDATLQAGDLRAQKGADWLGSTDETSITLLPGLGANYIPILVNNQYQAGLGTIVHELYHVDQFEEFKSDIRT
jgi:RHS repeat-associated protein